MELFCLVDAGLLSLRGRPGRPPRLRPLSHDPLRQLSHPDGSLSLQATPHSQQLPRHLTGRLRPRRRRLPARRSLHGAHVGARSALQPLRLALLLRHLRLQRFRQYHFLFLCYNIDAQEMLLILGADTRMGSYKETLPNQFVHLTYNSSVNKRRCNAF